MSNRKVKGLSIAHIVEERTRSEKQRKMADRDTTESELLAEVERMCAELSQRDGEVAELKTKVTRAHAELECVKKPLENRLARLEHDLE